MNVPPLLFLALAVVFWGSTYRATAIGTESAAGIVFAAVRAVPVALVFLIVFHRRVRRLRPSTLAGVGATGCLMVTGFLVALSESVDRAGAANSSVLLNTAPLFVAGLAPLLLAEPLSLRRAAGVAVGFGGVVLMFSSQLELDGTGTAVGMGIALAGGVAWGAGTLIVKWFNNRDRDLDGRSVVAIQYAAGAPLLVLVAALVPVRETQWSEARLWLSAAFVAVAAAAGTAFFFAALEALPATRVAAAQFAIPAVAVLIEVAAGSPPELVQALGIAVVVGSVAAVTVFGGRPREVAAAYEARA